MHISFNKFKFIWQSISAESKTSVEIDSNIIKDIRTKKSVCYYFDGKVKQLNELKEIHLKNNQVVTILDLAYCEITHSTLDERCNNNNQILYKVSFRDNQTFDVFEDELYDLRQSV